MDILKNELDVIYKSLKKDKELMEAKPKDEDFDHYRMVCHLITKFEFEGKINLKGGNEQ
jgi:hypothetical protein